MKVVTGASKHLLSSADFKRVEKQADAGDGAAFYCLFKHFAYGLGDPSLAEPHLQASADLLFPLAIYHLGLIKLGDLPTGTFEKNVDEGMRLLRLAESLGFTKAANYLRDFT